MSLPGRAVVVDAPRWVGTVVPSVLLGMLQQSIPVVGGGVQPVISLCGSVIGLCVCVCDQSAAVTAVSIPGLFCWRCVLELLHRVAVIGAWAGVLASSTKAVVCCMGVCLHL